MKKLGLTTLGIMLLFSSTMFAQDTSANDAYIKAMTTNDVNQRAQLLKTWLNTYGDKGHQYENFANATLCTSPYAGKTPDDTIKYGERALAIGGLDDSNKCSVLLNTAMMYVHKGQNLSKAKNYSNQVIQVAKEAMSKTPESAGSWNKMIGAGYFLQGQALEKDNDLKNAVTAYINSYNILKTKEIMTNLAKIGKALYEAKDYADAEKAFKIAAAANGDFGTTVYYAKALHRTGKKAEALKYYKQAYDKQKNGEVAFNIGILLANGSKSNLSTTEEAIQYLLEASFLSPKNSKKAMQLAEGLYFNQNKEYNLKVQELQAKSENLEKLTNLFNKKFGEKEEEDLTEAETKEMKSMLAQIDAEHKAIEKLQEEQKTALEKFNLRIEQTKQKLGVK
jgi:tetratricopeptide (TPR) repeat protein